MDLTSFIEAATPLRALGIIVEQNGREIARHLWEGSCRRNIYSASKSFTSAAGKASVRGSSRDRSPSRTASPTAAEVKLLLAE